MAFSNETLRTESDVLSFHADRFACVMPEGAFVDSISISRPWNDIPSRSQRP